MSEPANPYKEKAQLAKAVALADLLFAARITASMITAASDEQRRKFWAIATEGAKVHPPSEETRALVIEMLARREHLEQAGIKR